MNGKEHAVLGISWGVAAAVVFFMLRSFDVSILMYPLVGMVGGLLPDIDHNSSKIGRVRKLLIDYSTLMSLILIGIYFTPYGESIPRFLMLPAAFMIFYFILKKTGCIKFLTRHRGLTHYIEFYMLLCGLSYFFLGHDFVLFMLANSLLAGYASHLAGDGTTTEGIQSLFFRKFRIRVGGFKDKTVGHNIMLGVVFILPHLIVFTLIFLGRL